MAKKRNRLQTEDRIVAAAVALLIDSGFSNFGVNAIAREAQADKVLIYRYFSSVDGILLRIISNTVFWPQPDLLNRTSCHAFLRDTFSHLQANKLSGLFIAHPFDSSLRTAINEANAAHLQRWMNGFFSHFKSPPPKSTIEVVAYTLWSAACHFVDFPQAIFELTDPFDSWIVSRDSHLQAFSTASSDEELPTELL